MTGKTSLAAGLAAAALLALSACSGSTSSGTSTASPSSSSTGQQSGSPAGGGSAGAGGGGPQGQTFTDVNLNTDGDSPGGANTAAVVAATNTFLATLDATQKDAVEYDFTDHKARVTWSNYPAVAVPREGIQLTKLSADQLKAAYAVLQTALSSQGDQQDVNIQAADDDLVKVSADGNDDFGALKDYYLAVYGTPSATAPFAVQFGGHHLARNLTYNGDKVSQTPQFVGSEPTSFEVDGKTVAPVKAEADGMFGMIAALTDDQKTSAELTSGTYDDLLMGPGKDSGTFPASEGLEVSTLSDAQQQQVTTAIAAYVRT